MKSKRVILLGGKFNRQIVHVMNNRSVVNMMVKPDVFAEGIYDLDGPPEPPKPLETVTYSQRFFKYNGNRFSWWCERSMNPQECLICYCYPHICNEAVGERRKMAPRDELGSIPIPRNMRNRGERLNVAELLDPLSTAAIKIAEKLDRPEKRC